MIRIVTPHITPRLEYTFRFVFGTVLRTEYQLVPAALEALPDAIFYGSNPPSGKWAAHIPASGLLQTTGVGALTPPWVDWQGLPVLFPQEGAELPFDIFSAVFYCLSRYEEYQATPRDAHGRFPSSASVLKPHLERPIADQWIMAFAKWLSGKGLIDAPAVHPLRWVNTIDIDIAYAYKGRGIGRGAGAAAKDLLSGKIARFTERLRVLSGRSTDPYDTYELIRKAAGSASETLFFILCGKRAGYDINLDLEGSAMQHLIRGLDRWGRVGVHPSYASNNNPEKLPDEIALLAKVLGRPVDISRQHFLKFDLPDTYRRLAAAGIKRDYSMGYADAVGFRSGTAYPHHFYDIEAEQILDIELVPLAAMDSALLHYMKLTPEQAIEKLRTLWANALPTGGQFVTVWHNHSLAERDEWVGWSRVFRNSSSLLAHAAF